MSGSDTESGDDHLRPALCRHRGFAGKLQDRRPHNRFQPPIGLVGVQSGVVWRPRWGDIDGDVANVRDPMQEKLSTAQKDVAAKFRTLFARTQPKPAPISPASPASHAGRQSSPTGSSAICCGTSTTRSGENVERQDAPGPNRRRHVTRYPACRTANSDPVIQMPTRTPNMPTTGSRSGKITIDKITDAPMAKGIARARASRWPSQRANAIAAAATGSTIPRKVSDTPHSA